jgi:hypothetical protein
MELVYTRCSLCRLIRLLSTWCRAAEFLSASGAALSQEVADGKMNVKSACALNIRYIHAVKLHKRNILLNWHFALKDGKLISLFRWPEQQLETLRAPISSPSAKDVWDLYKTLPPISPAPSSELHKLSAKTSRSQWPRGLRHELFPLARTLGSWVRIPLKGWMFVCVYSVCIGSVLATGWSPIQGVLPTVLGLRNWSKTKRFTDALCSKVGATGKRERKRSSPKEG